MVQLARVIYSNIYREDDRPECKAEPLPMDNNAFADAPQTVAATGSSSRSHA